MGGARLLTGLAVALLSAVLGAAACSSFGSGPGDDLDASSADGSSPEACEDATFCDDKCGASLKDKCGVVRDCSTPCGDARRCDGLKCVCDSSASWCQGRCGAVKDNCQRDVVCSGCEAGACTNGTCNGCVPDSTTKTCTGKTCGLAVNNCGQQVDCGSCSGGAACNNNTCCNPASVTCKARCGVVTNNCGQTVSCLACCPDGKPVGAVTNCGACGRNCDSFTCTGTTCSCPGHNTNTDPNDCGACSIVGYPTLKCVARGFSQCYGGQCK